MANTVATQRRGSQGLATGKGEATTLHNLTSTVELAASSTGDTVDFGRIPTTARITGLTIYHDDLATTGAPTLDIGLGAVNSNLANADDPDAIANGYTLATAASPSAVGSVSDPANIGLPAWDFVASEASDPGGVLKVYGTVVDAATTATGTVTLVLEYYLD